jgi:putative RNA 2'-phosphotransferase
MEQKISKFLSYVLRHKPEAIGLILDSEGWASIEALIAGAAKEGIELDLITLQKIVATNDKKRFVISEEGLRIRAAQGHSTAIVSIQHVEKIPPAVLYHGTATRFLNAILEQGLLAGSRHYVHLSESSETAFSVGQRYGKPIVLKIKALQMQQQGFSFFQAENNVWLTNHVPKEFIEH